MVIITKLEAAHRQLTTAIRMFFDDGDVASVHTLAGAARELYEKHCAARGIERMFDHIQATNPGKSEKMLWEALNGPRNFLKHPDPTFDLNASLDIDDEANVSILFIASHDCAALCGHAQPLEAQVFNAWCIGARFPDFTAEEFPADEESMRASQTQLEIEAAFPGLRRGSLADQKRLGRNMLSQAESLRPTL